MALPHARGAADLDCQEAESARRLRADPQGLHGDAWLANWVAVQELKLSYHNPETILFTVFPYCGNFI